MKNRQHCFGFHGIVSDYIRTELQAGFKVTTGILNPFSLSTASQKPVLKQAGGIYNEARVTTVLTIYGFLSAAEKTLFFFLPAKPRPESAQKAV